jgi:hypothetical protein
MFLFDFLIPSLQLILDFREQSDLFLELADLFCDRSVVIVTLPIHLHELVQRFL